MSASPLPDEEVEVIDLTASDTESNFAYPTNGHHNGLDRDEYDEEEEYFDEDVPGPPPEFGLTTRVLHSVIATVPESRLRAVVARLAKRVPAARALLESEFVALDADTGEPVPRWETCANCEREIDMSLEREQGECVFHPGYLVPNRGHPEDDSSSDPAAPSTTANGEPMDTLVPQSNGNGSTTYVWSCCKQHPSSPGCVRDVHRPADTNVGKKRKV